MAIEIERKFLVKDHLLPSSSTQTNMVQAYLCNEPDRTIRVRVAGEQAFFTIKGMMKGISRLEFEYEIPVDDAWEIIKMAVSQPVEKVRHEIYHAGMKWEVDFFSGENQGLVMAEIELSSEDESFELPEWVGQEVTGDSRYYNSQLSRFPFSQW